MSNVYLSRCESYDPELLMATLSPLFRKMGLTPDALAGRRVVLKPNLVRKMDASLAGTTHPAMVEAVARILREEYGVSELTLAESPGGIYTEASLRGAYRVCGMEEVCNRCGIRMNFDTSYTVIDCPDGQRTGSFHIIRPIAEADVIFNLCKLKSHGLTMMTAAVKNYFGTIPGTEKFEMHARYPDLSDFSEMLVELCHLHTCRATTVNIVDGIVGMEGNGPTNGSPRKIGVLAASLDPFALDETCERILGIEGKVRMLRIAEQRGFLDPSNTEVIGECVDNLRLSDFVLPDSSIQVTSLLTNGALMRIFEPRPTVDKKSCVGCGECVRSCPKHTITLDKAKRRARINPSLCIRCFCCQELCPHDAVRIRRNPLLRWIR